MTTLAEVRQRYPQYGDLSDEQLAGALHKKYYSDMPFEEFSQKIGYTAPVKEPEKPSVGQQVTDALNPIAQAEQSMAGLSGIVAAPISGLAGLAGIALPGPQGQGARWAANAAEALTYQPRTEAGKRRVAASDEGMGLIDRAADYVGEKTGAPTDVLGATGVKTALLALPMALGARGGPRVAARALTERPVEPLAVSKSKPTPAPSVEQLKAQSAEAYKAAESAGVVISKDAMTRIAEQIRQEAAAEGIDATLHPQALAALQRLRDAGKEHTSLKGAEILRRVIKDAEATPTNPANARMAGVIRDAFDEAMDGLGSGDVLSGKAADAMSSLRNARELYSRARKGQDIEELFHRSELRAGANYTQAQLETALRQEFKSLALNKRRMRGFNAEERLAIERVAKGAPLENALRFVGKFAPSGNISTAISGGLGFLAGGPAGAVGLPIAGEVAKRLATRATMKNAKKASEIVRRGPKQLEKQ